MSEEEKSSPIVLPPGCKSLHSWKVRDGSSVRKGETVALAYSLSSSLKRETSTSSSMSRDDDKKDQEMGGGAAGGGTSSEVKKVGENKGEQEKTSPVVSAVAAMAAPPSSSSSRPNLTRTNSGGGGGGRATLRERMKKRAAAKNKVGITTSSLNGSGPDAINQLGVSGADLIKIVSPADGFLRVVLMTSTAVDDSKSSSSSGGTEEMTPRGNDGATGRKEVLGYIDPCAHPTMVENMCAVCGKTYQEMLEETQQKKRDKKRGGTMNTSSSASAYENNAVGGADAVAPLPVENRIPRRTRGGGGARLLQSLVVKAGEQQQGNSAATTRGRAVKRSATSMATTTNEDDDEGDEDGRDEEDAVSSSTGTASQSVTVSGGITLQISAAEARSMAEQSRNRLVQSNKLSLVLDLDHTLVHATADARAAEEATTRDDVRIAILRAPAFQPPPTAQRSGVGGAANVVPPENGPMLRHFIKLRPHLREFLDRAMDKYELSIYTAGTRAYALQVADVICRYAVGATADEEELQHMRSYVAHTTKRVERMKAVRDANAKMKREEGEKVVEKKKKAGAGGDGAEGPKKAVSFGDEEDVEMTTEEGTAKKRKRAEDEDDDGDVPVTSKRKVSFGEPEGTSTNGEKKEGMEGNEKEEKKVSFGNVPTLTPEKKGEAGDGGVKTNSETPAQGVEEEASSKVVENKQGEEEDDGQDLEMTLEEVRTKLKEAEKQEVKAQELRKKLIGSRIVSRTDVGDLGKDVKSLKRVFPDGGLMTAIVDDREDVWANASDNERKRRRPGEPPMNLLLARPYHWKRFLGYADVNNSSGDDLMSSVDSKDGGVEGENQSTEKPDEEPRDKDKEDCQLLWMGDILERLHKRFYAQHSNGADVTVPHVLESMRSGTLRGCILVLSGLVPLHHQAQGMIRDPSKPRPSVVRYAEDLGAKVVSDVTPEVTHVVAARPGTEKVRRATKVKGCAVVKISWLMQCYWSVSKVDVNAHLWTPIRTEETCLPQQAPVANTGTTAGTLQEPVVAVGESDRPKILLSDSSEEDDDDDDDDDDEGFAEEFEQDMLE